MKLKKMLKNFAVFGGLFGMFTLTGCGNDTAGNSNAADLVVYGKVFTAEDNQLAEAFAVKDGKYIYVGDKQGAEKFVENGKTEVVDYSGKGIITPITLLVMRLHQPEQL